MPPPSGSTIYEPTGYTPGDPVNLLLACHSAGRTSTDPFGTEGNACIASAQAAGYLCAASDAQNTAWGNAASVADYIALIAYCEATYNVTGIMLWGSSMGGLAALTMSGYLRGAKVRGALLVQPVCDLEATYNDHPAFQATIDPAYSMTGYSAVAVGAYDPFDRPASEYADLRYRFYASPSDTYVSKVLNADAMAAKIASVALEADVVAVTGEHGDPSHWSWAAFEPFIERVFTPIDPPAITGSDVDVITDSGATITGNIDPNGAATTYRVQYGETTSYGTNTSWVSAGSGSSPVAIEVPLAGLAPGTAYHARLVAENAGGTTSGPDVEFTTDASPVPDVGLTLAESGIWTQSGTAITARALIGRRSTVTATAYSENGGAIWGDGEDADRFDIDGESLDGESAVVLEAGVLTNLTLGVTPQDGDELLAIRIGIPE